MTPSETLVELVAIRTRNRETKAHCDTVMEDPSTTDLRKALCSEASLRCSREIAALTKAIELIAKIP